MDKSELGFREELGGKLSHENPLRNILTELSSNTPPFINLLLITILSFSSKIWSRRFVRKFSVIIIASMMKWRQNRRSLRWHSISRQNDWINPFSVDITLKIKSIRNCPQQDIIRRICQHIEDTVLVVRKQSVAHLHPQR
ncbi:hypothetical protein CDAR_190151 [Caerostris darwini]|uniref:Uncharacterized protein n=1 Tax=Caerostris darwini TaxID=1538125 RepID=A0AAV4WQF9_9ARAC|nr:hypothetical protein CDAR_190151 [Caerostris darwini]